MTNDAEILLALDCAMREYGSAFDLPCQAVEGQYRKHRVIEIKIGCLTYKKGAGSPEVTANTSAGTGVVAKFGKFYMPALKSEVEHDIATILSMAKHVRQRRQEQEEAKKAAIATAVLASRK